MPVGSLFNKALYAFKFGEPNIVLSRRVHTDSKILYAREPRARRTPVPPWLTADGGPSPAAPHGRTRGDAAGSQTHRTAGGPSRGAPGRRAYWA